MCQLGGEAGGPNGESKTRIVGNNTLIGQVGTFMENLHMSYDEVLYLPYSLLLAILADKLRVTSENENITQELSGKDMLAKKKQLQKT